MDRAQARLGLVCLLQRAHSARYFCRLPDACQQQVPLVLASCPSAYQPLLGTYLRALVSWYLSLALHAPISRYLFLRQCTYLTCGAGVAP